MAIAQAYMYNYTGVHTCNNTSSEFEMDTAHFMTLTLWAFLQRE